MNLNCFMGSFSQSSCAGRNPVSLSMIETNRKEAWAEYKINDQFVLYVKHRTIPRAMKREEGIAWGFTFGPDHVKRIREMKSRGEVHVVLVCGEKDLDQIAGMQTCLILSHKIDSLLDLSSSKSQTITVKYFPGTGKSLRVRGSFSGSMPDLVVPRCGLDTWEVPGSRLPEQE